ncbi:MAG: ASKHA domain-containing protein [Clostridiales Family XIII bacterium]|jgi:uncharacterized 2Fe-2S/4Fe-4S cluster protein (DUF4445 family)|nr:ASKHA domain-containing protein [Clostridiales Family XIII bacterium]
MIRVRIEGTGKTARAGGGDNLLTCLREAGLPVRADCGGAGTCGKCRVLVDGKPALACQTILTREITVALPEMAGDEELSAGKNDLLTARQVAAGAARGGSAPDGFAAVSVGGEAPCFIAIDLGTTTIAVSLIDRARGSVLSSASFLNPQCAYGADVISRINASLDDSSALSALVRERLAGEMASMMQKTGVGRDGLGRIVVAGNTTMSYLLLGLPCRSLGFAPFKPAYPAGGYYEAGSLFGAEFSDVKCLVMPYLSAFVGGDITAGLLSADHRDDYFIIDMGTNGELASLTDGRLLCSSTAAGPAFEGVNLSCGMGGTAGAVSRVWLDSGEIRFATIGGKTPVGICGSGVLDIIACLIRAGAMRANGKLDESHPLVADKRVVIAGQVVFTQKDVREFQLAKSAIRSGIEILLAETGGVVPNCVLLAGGFGQHLDPESAFVTGLLPALLRGRVTAAGNTSLAGAIRVGFDPSLLERADDYRKISREINLATHPNFSDMFMNFMRFEG